MTRPTIVLFGILFCFSKWVVAIESSQCRTVRMADIGWTDVSATTAITAEVLRAIGYTVEVKFLTTPVAFAGLENNDLDVFLGYWVPTMRADIAPYLERGAVSIVKKNLNGAIFTLAVPDYVYGAGVQQFSDLQKFSDQFKKTIFAIEPGNDGNRLILQMIEDNAYGLSGWRLIESSEQGMLTEVNKHFLDKNFVVFLAWKPHPMNLSLPIRYLEGGEDYFGPHQGRSHVYTVTRTGFLDECPNLEQFFNNLEFSMDLENQVMRLILEDNQSPQIAARNWLQQNPAQASVWLKNVSTVNGEDAQTAFLASLSSDKDMSAKKLRAPIGRWIEIAITYLTAHFSGQLRIFSDVVERSISQLVELLLMPHWSIVIALFSACTFIVRRSIKLVLLLLTGLLLIVNLELWVETLQTLVLVTIASIVSVMIGVPFGILAARKAWFYTVLRPMLDLMQTIPTFVYLIPTLMLFGLGVVPGLISTIIFAIAAPIRLTYLGVKSVPKELVEASVAFGATPTQTLLKVEIPCALPSIMTGFTQCIMLSLSMVVIAALVGAQGLGTPVIRALNTVNIEQGIESGLAIVIVAIVLDRILSSYKKNLPDTNHG